MIMCTQPNCSNYCDDNSPKLACKHPLNLCPKDLGLLIRAHIKKGQTIVKCPNSTCTAFMYNTDVRKWMYQNDENESEFLCHHPLALESLNAISFFFGRYTRLCLIDIARNHQGYTSCPNCGHAQYHLGGSTRGIDLSPFLLLTCVLRR